MELEKWNWRDVDNYSFHVEILKYLVKYPKDWKTPKLFIDGEFDSNQSVFEQESNHLKIGVLAYSKLQGYCLLQFLRILKTNHYKLLIWRAQDSKKEERTLKSWCKFYQTFEMDYTDIYELTSDKDQVISRTLFGSNGQDMIVERRVDQVSTWTAESLLGEFLNLDQALFDF